MSIVKFFSNSEIRFIDHPTEKYGFGIVADDLGRVLDHTNSRVIVESVDDDWKGVSNVYTPGGTQSISQKRKSHKCLHNIRIFKPNLSQT